MRSTSIGCSGHVAVVVQLADRDAERWRSRAHHGVVFEGGELAHAHPGPGQELDHEPTTAVRDRSASAAMNFAAVGSSKNLGSGSSSSGKSLGKIRTPGRGIVVVPFDDALEERAQQAEPVPDGAGREGLPPCPGRAACQVL